MLCRVGPAAWTEPSAQPAARPERDASNGAVGAADRRMHDTPGCRNHARGKLDGAAADPQTAARGRREAHARGSAGTAADRRRRAALSHGPTALEHDLAIIGTECAYPVAAANETGAIVIRRLRPGRHLLPGREHGPAGTAGGPRDGGRPRLHRREPSGRRCRSATHARETYRDARDADIGGYAVRRDLENLVAAFVDAEIRGPATLVAVVDGRRLWQWAKSRGWPRCSARFAPSGREGPRRPRRGIGRRSGGCRPRSSPRS